METPYLADEELTVMLWAAGSRASWAVCWILFTEKFIYQVYSCVESRVVDLRERLTPPVGVGGDFRMLCMCVCGRGGHTADGRGRAGAGLGWIPAEPLGLGSAAARVVGLRSPQRGKGGKKGEGGNRGALQDPPEGKGSSSDFEKI